MIIERKNIETSLAQMPAIGIVSANPDPAILLLHGYGGAKEETLGLGYRLAETRGEAICVDLRGHGENMSPASIETLDDINALVNSLKSQKRIVFAIGHSFGGLIALLSEADFRIGISPAFGKPLTPSLKAMIRDLRSYRVTDDSDDVFEIIENLSPKYMPDRTRDFVITAEKDPAEIKNMAEIVNVGGVRVAEIPRAGHGDVFLYETTYRLINDFIDERLREENRAK